MKNTFKIIDVLGTKVDDILLTDAVEEVARWLEADRQRYIVTPNPEIIMAARSDSDLQQVLNDADLAIPDGIGLKLAGVQNRVAGIDLMINLIELATQKGYKVGFIGGRKGVAKKTAEVLQKKYPRLKVLYAIQGPVIPAKAGIYTNKDLWIPDQVRDDKVDILFVAFGHGKQEKWISQNLNKFSVRVAMAVGGSFDYISGQVPRAPKIIRDMGLEWLFRLIIQPSRITRQLALITYIWLLLTKRK